MKNFLTPEQIIELKQAHKREKNRKYADRIKIILALNDGFTYEQLSRIFILDDSTIRDYVSRYQSGGIKKLTEMITLIRSGFLKKEEETELRNHLNENTYLSSKKIKLYIFNKYKVLYSIEGLRKLLHRLGFVYKKPHFEPGKTKVEKQQKWVYFYEELKKICQKENAAMYFSDAAHPTHNGRISYGWILKTENKILKTASSSKRINIQGAVSLEKKEIITSSSKTINTQSSIQFFKKILKKNTDRNKIYIIVDNARYYKSKIMKAWLSKNTKIELIFIPAYSPNLNIIERLWRYLHKNIIYNRYFEKFSDFKKKIRYFFATIRHRWHELETLLVDNFHILEHANFSDFKVV